MKLIIEPAQGVAPLLSAIKNARESIELAIFRFDRGDIEEALKAAVGRGVKVTALIAYANRGGEKNLRKLEMRFLEAGITVARTAGDLLRYHDKIMVIDRRVLLMLSFNFTHLDIDHSRAFGIVSKNIKWVEEAARLLEADSTRTPYVPRLDTLVVSPVNSRKVLRDFLLRAKKQLLIYDPKISDRAMIRILQDRAKAGVEIRIIGRIDKRADVPIAELTRFRLHTRAIIRDRHQAFVGSQGLRSVELDSRREVGLIVRESSVVKGLIDTFESDWASREAARELETGRGAVLAIPREEAESAVHALVQELHPLTATVKRAVKRTVAKTGEEGLKDETVKDAVNEVVRNAVKEALAEVARDPKKHH